MTEFENYLYFRKLLRICKNPEIIRNKDFKFFVENHFPNLEKYAESLENYHGIGHLIETVVFGIYLAHSLNIYNKEYIVITCAYHDLIRNSELNHGQESLEFIKNLGIQTNPYIDEAIINHTNNFPTTNPVLQILRDADRIRLSWERGYEEKYFSTKSGKRLAMKGLETQRSLMNYLIEDFIC